MRCEGCSYSVQSVVGGGVASPCSPHLHLKNWISVIFTVSCLIVS